MLGADESANPGPYKSSRTPYARGIGDALSDDSIQEVYLQKSAQSAGSETGRNALGRWLEVDPGPALIVFPDEKSCRDTVDERIVPLLTNTPTLARLKTGAASDIKKDVIRLKSCSIFTGWAGSPQALASRPIRYLILDEVSKYPKWSGREADAVSLSIVRTLSYRHRRKVFGLSTPTTPGDAICKLVAQCGDVRRFCPACVHCGELREPKWEQVSWEGQGAVGDNKLRRIKRMLESGEIDAIYTCEACGEGMTDAQYRVANKRGQWVSDGHPPGEHPKSQSVGFVLSGLCSPLIGIQKAAREWIVARLVGIGATQGFFNSILGLPFGGTQGAEAAALEITEQRVLELALEGGEAGVVPPWATSVVCGCDSGRRDHPYVVRAFGPLFRSQLLDFGALGATNVREEAAELLDRVWHAADGRTFRIRRLLMDSGGGGKRGTAHGSITERVYRVAQSDPARIWAIKGVGGGGEVSQPIRTSTITYRPPGERHAEGLDVMLSAIDTEYFKDLVATYIAGGIWHPFKNVTIDYVRQVASEIKSFVELKRKANGDEREIWRWKPRSSGAANHFWDCEVYAVVAAHMIGADELEVEPPPSEPADSGGGWWSGAVSEDW